MKSIRPFLSILFIAGLITLPGCDPVDVTLPDLNPGTAEGGEILIFEIFDLIEYSSDASNNPGALGGISREYDFQGDGSVDLRVVSSVESTPFLGISGSTMSLKFVGGLLLEYEPVPPLLIIPTPGTGVFLPVDALTGIELSTGGWASSWERVDINTILPYEGIGPGIMFENYPAGVSYLPTRSRINGEDFYGWLEVISSDHDDADTNEQFIISRFGISQTPGLRIRMGQS